MRRHRNAFGATRRGNTIVLVVGVLVLLVIIATSFVSRTHAGRVTAVATTKAALRDDHADVIARQIAGEIAEALFARPVAPLDLDAFNDATGNTLASSNFPRLPIPPAATRYGVDPTRMPPPGGNGPDNIPNTADDVLRFPYNFAPFQVVPWTNWPDGRPLNSPSPRFPAGPGNPGGGTASPNLDMDGNPVGDPGFGDSRWLCDFEPQRWDATGVAGIPDGILDAFSHWRHLSYIARPGNGYLLCRDIADVTDANNDGVGSVLANYAIPVEQWLPIRPASLTQPTVSLTGSPNFNYYSGSGFIEHWSHWFSGDYELMYWNNTGAGFGFDSSPPANFWDLSDLNANGLPGELGERPEDEFAGPSPAWPFGAPRWNVGRVLADTDGDGFTDSFWFLVPGTVEGGIRQIVAVRIIDNCSMINVNTATRLVAAQDPAIGFPTATVGMTPADVALAGDLTNVAYGPDLSVGFADNPAHWEVGMAPAPEWGVMSPFGTSTIAWSFNRYFEGGYGLLAQLGVNASVGFPFALETAGERLRYWNLAGRRPFGASHGLTPFTLADELELRMYHGNNYPWIMSALERAFNPIGLQEDGFGVDYSFLHSTNDQVLNPPQVRQESSEHLDQLRNRELLADSRRRMTVYSAARNDVMPRWLWPSLFPLDLDNPPNGIDLVEFDHFLLSTRKLDLRRPVFDALGNFDADVDGNGLANQILPMAPLRDDDINDDLVVDVNDHYHLLADRFLRALTDGDENAGNGFYGSYSSSTDAKFEDLRRAAAGLAANLVQYRDEDAIQHLPDDAVRLPGLGTLPPDHDTRMLGLEPQPFLTEALVGHFYEAQDIPPGYLNSDPPANVVHASFPHSAVVIVQIANPYDRPVNLTDFKLRVFGNVGGSFGGVNTFLMPDEARTYYAINTSVAGAVALVDALNLGVLGDSILVNWPSDRSTYDAGDPEEAIELVRTIDGVDVVVDRIDHHGQTGSIFGTGQQRLGDEVVALAEPPNAAIPPPAMPPTQNHPGIVVADDATGWLQWVHVNRAWWEDDDGDTLIGPLERNPRFIFQDRDLQAHGGEAFAAGGVPPSLTEFFSRRDKVCTSCPPRSFTLQMLHKGTDGTETFGGVTLPDYPDEHEGIVQVGELANLWMFGHELSFTGATYSSTRTTFSEFMGARNMTGDDERVNRLRFDPETVITADLGQLVGRGDPDTLTDRRHAVPALPAGVRVIESFVCDGPSPGGVPYGLAQQYTGRSTPGLINVAGAPPEVMRTLPHMTRLVAENNVTPATNPFVRAPEAIVQYRERYNGLNPLSDPSAAGWIGGPDYTDRDASGGLVEDMRGERGLASIGELMLVDRPATMAGGPLDPQGNWRLDFAGLVTGGAVPSVDLSTDVADVFDPSSGTYVPDQVARDAEERNLLFAGLSNLVTTRSDTFTVYLKIRSFRQNPVTGAWNATDPEYIVDDSRYVMLVDRSEVDHAREKPKILYFEKLPR